MIAILVVYVLCVICAALTELGGMLMYCEYGRQDQDYIAAKTFFLFSIIFPYAIYKIIKMRLDIADKMEEGAEQWLKEKGYETAKKRGKK